MKRIKLIALFLGVSTIAVAQNNFIGTSTATGGSVYFGTPTAGPIGGVNLQVHGVYDFCEEIKGGKASTACSPTSRFLMTNAFTGLTATDGMLFKLSNHHFFLNNQENGNIRISTNGLHLNFEAQTKRLWLGNVPFSTTPEIFAMYNVNASSNENGVFIQTNTASKYGLSIATRSLTDNAIQVMGTTGTDRNFSVQANGFVFARKYTTTLANIPDYVFDTNYELMPLADLKSYITTNHHLPNIPSAAEYGETGVDLGELNRLLLEKTEELTLYILQLEERLTKLEKK